MLEGDGDVSDSWEGAVDWYRANASLEDLRANYMDLPQIDAMARFCDSREMAATLRLIGGASRGQILELGAGAGVCSVALARKGWQVTALEPETGLTTGTAGIEALAHEAGVAVVARAGVGEDMPFADATFDAVYGRQVLHHVRDLDRTMAEVFRVLRPGGSALFVREHVAEDEQELEAFLDGHPLHHRYGGENALPLARYLEAAAAGGLNLEHLLLPLDSVINTFPMNTRQRVRARLSGVVRGYAGATLRQRWRGEAGSPGRLYSFLWTKPAAIESGR